MVCGLRGFPDVQGGVETHSQHLYPLIVDQGCRVTVLTRHRYQVYPSTSWKGVFFKRIWAPKISVFEAIVHTLLCVLYAAIKRPDVLHIHAIGPSMLTPLARLFRLKVVVTNHGPDYDREKWGSLARVVLRMGEAFGMRYSNRRIVISDVIADLVKNNYGANSDIIPNGVRMPELLKPADTLRRFELLPERYILLVSRLVPEKRHLDLIEAYKRLDDPEWKLAIVGSADHQSNYEQEVLAAAAATPGVVCTGFLSGDELGEVFSNAGVFVLPSSHEGLPIALLEALSYGLPAVASDIPAHLCVKLPQECYFPLGDVARLVSRLKEQIDIPLTAGSRADTRTFVQKNYNWPDIAQLTLGVYQSLAQEKA